MSAAPQALACQLEDLKQLDSKPFHKYARGYLETINRNLTSAEFRVFTYLEEHSHKNYRNGGLVIQSAYEIAKGIGRSARTVKTHLASLKRKGYIDGKSANAAKGIYRRNCIRLTCPQTTLEEILLASPNIVKLPQKESTGYLCVMKSAQQGEDFDNHSFNNRNIDKPIIKTNIRGLSQLDNFEPVDEAIEPSDIFLNEPTSANVPQGTQTQPNPEPQPENFKGGESETFKPQAEVARFITKAERTEVVKKVKAMKRDGEIHANVQASYQDIMVLVQHVIVHCMYRNVFKKSFKHALNSAARGIRNGTWTTPYRVSRKETLKRERLANEAKEQEKRECQELELGKMVGQAMRLTHGPSEADIARFKADALERGVNSLGQNASRENIARLKALIQKTVEDKQKERLT